jgi:hypothetical protein
MEHERPQPTQFHALAMCCLAKLSI